MPNPTKRAQKAIAALAQKHGLSLNESKLGERETRIHTLYAGGSRLRELLDSVDFAFAQCGSKGEFVAILPAEKLMELLETEAVYNSSCESQSNLVRAVKTSKRAGGASSIRNHSSDASLDNAHES